MSIAIRAGNFLQQSFEFKPFALDETQLGKVFLAPDQLREQGITMVISERGVWVYFDFRFVLKNRAPTNTGEKEG